MAQVNLTSALTKWALQDVRGNPTFGVRLIGEGTAHSFPVIFMDVEGVTYYYWPNSSGALRYGTTEPTVDTMDTAGGAV